MVSVLRWFFSHLLKEMITVSLSTSEAGWSVYVSYSDQSEES